jgi:hypothetical protein
VKSHPGGIVHGERQGVPLYTFSINGDALYLVFEADTLEGSKRSGGALISDMFSITSAAQSLFHALPFRGDGPRSLTSN